MKLKRNDKQRGVILCNRCRKLMTSDECPHCGNDRCFIGIYHQGKYVTIRRDLSEHIFYFDTAYSYLMAINKTDRKVLVTPELDVETQLELWLHCKKKSVEMGELAPSYYRNLEGYVRNHFADYFANWHVLMIDKESIQMFKDTLKTQKIKTRKNILHALHNFMTWLEENDKIDKIPAFPKIKGDDARVSQALTVEEQAEALSLLPEKHRHIFLFGTETGLRSGELCAVKVGDINLRQGTMLVQRTLSAGTVRETTKGKHKNVIPLSEDALRIAAANMKGKNRNDFLFTQPIWDNGKSPTQERYTINRLYRLWLKYRTEKFADITVHELIRHSFCTQLMNNTSINAMLAKDVMRHADVKMTDRYTHRNVEQSRQYINGRKDNSHLKLVHSASLEVSGTPLKKEEKRK
ncbi:MAG TPA: site-specific integrase [Syntrophorhabdus sp.]|jgi:integrase|nr:MAG: site-specific tyrosine recombinase XerC [Deltaproteobacteria bacterium ADurb.Bin135]HPB38803.1 site-specific integrase [Syntrophorhabdus sp.]